MKELTEAERVLDGFAMTVRSLVGQESEVSRVLDDVQRQTYLEAVAGLLRHLDDCPAEILMASVQGARMALERRRAPERP